MSKKITTVSNSKNPYRRNYKYEDKIFLKVVKPSKEFRKENFVSIIFLEES